MEAKQKLEDGATYIGPYVSSWAVKQAVDEARKIFRIPTCNRKFPQEIGKGRPCLNYFIKQCSAPCRGKIKENEYREQVKDALDFLRGGSSASIRDLTERMNEAAENLEFERAARIRDRIQAIRNIGDKQKVVATRDKESKISLPLRKDLGIVALRFFDFPMAGYMIGKIFLWEMWATPKQPYGIFTAILRNAASPAPNNHGRRTRKRGYFGAVAIGKSGTKGQAGGTPKRGAGAAGPNVLQ